MFLLPVSKIAKHCNPYEGCWLDVGTRPITLAEVSSCLAQGKERLSNTERRSAPRSARSRHVQKIAFFVRNGYQEPLQIDVGVPQLGLHISYVVQDGNHRLAADIYRRDVLGESPLTRVEVSGDIAHAKSLGLWARSLEAGRVALR
jgi:hypothetical protein